MAETKSGSRSGSKLNLNESTMPLLDDEAHEKAETPEKDAIELKEKASTTSEAEKDDSSPEKTEEGGEKKDVQEDKKAKKERKEREKKEKKERKEKEKAEKAAEKSQRVRPTTQCRVQAFTAGLNMLDRDEKHINDTVNLDFSDVLAEPESSPGFDPIWRVAYLLFSRSHTWLYRLLAAVFALPLALVWGIAFSLITFVSVWLATPVVRVLEVVLYYVRRVWAALVNTALEPVTHAFGACLSSVKVAHTNNQPQTV